MLATSSRHHKTSLQNNNVVVAHNNARASMQGGVLGRDLDRLGDVVLFGFSSNLIAATGVKCDPWLFVKLCIVCDIRKFRYSRRATITIHALLGKPTQTQIQARKYKMQTDTRTLVQKRGRYLQFTNFVIDDFLQYP